MNMALDIHKILATALLDLCRVKKLKDIKVKDLLDETGVSRQTFYNRFRDKADLVQWTYENMVLSEFHKVGDVGTYYENTLNYCRALEKYRFFMKQAYLLDSQNNLRDFIYEYATQYDYEWHLRHYEGDALPEDFRFISYYHSVASIYMEIQWICADDADRKTPEEMAETITRVRRISMSDTYFGKNNPIYDIPEETA